MRREIRRTDKDISDKIIMYAGIGIAILAIIVLALLLYSRSLNNNAKDETIDFGQLAKMNENNIQDSESASTDIGKSVEESENELNNTINENSTNTTNNIFHNTTNSTNTIRNTTKANNSAVTTQTNSNVIPEKEELKFELPVDGEIVREFAKDNRIYSETLQEWTTHLGIDIKAEKATVVKAAEAGIVKSIKNDPRYGLTIVIEHSDGFQTLYANLLTSEFVVEGEKVEKGQSIGTIGNTAVFEVADEPHLHFEILKDSIQVDPGIYLK